jgi:hypothetical protein
MERRILLIGLASAALLPLAACGRRSSPKPPEGSTYPREYPTGRAVAKPGAPAEADEDETPERLIPPAYPTLR